MIAVLQKGARKGARHRSKGAWHMKIELPV